MSKIKYVKTGSEHAEFYTALCDLLKKHTVHLSNAELLAIASNVVGKLVAMQDQRSCTGEQAMEIVINNIQEGNKQMVDELKHNSRARMKAEWRDRNFAKHPKPPRKDYEMYKELVLRGGGVIARIEQFATNPDCFYATTLNDRSGCMSTYEFARQWCETKTGNKVN